MRILLVFLSLTLSLTSLIARTWTSADGGKTIEGEYVSHTDEHVVIKTGRKDIVIKYEFLSARDKQWVDNHAKDSDPGQQDAAKGQASVGMLLKVIQHGDDESAVIRKLDNNPHIEASLDKTFLARVGLNGFFRTKETLNGQQYTFHFDWNENDRLTCITLRSEEFSKAEFEQTVKNAWSACNELVTKSYGEAAQASDYPAINVFNPKANLMITHVWHPEGENKTIALCVGVEEENAFIALNYYDRIIELQKL